MRSARPFYRLAALLVMAIPTVTLCQNGAIIKQFPIDGTEQILTRAGVTFDREMSSDGNGSLRVEASEVRTVRLLELPVVGIDNTRLIYRAKIKTSGVVGQVYLELWCVFPKLGEFFSRGLNQAVSGTKDWTTVETPFFLRKGEKPELLKLNLVVNGKGKAWIDAIEVRQAPLE